MKINRSIVNNTSDEDMILQEVIDRTKELANVNKLIKGINNGVYIAIEGNKNDIISIYEDHFINDLMILLEEYQERCDARHKSCFTD